MNHIEDNRSKPYYSLVAEHQASIYIIQLTLLVDHIESSSSSLSSIYELEVRSNDLSLGYIRDSSSRRQLCTFRLPALSRQPIDSLVFTRSTSTSNFQTHVLRLPSAPSARSDPHSHAAPLSLSSLQMSSHQVLGCSECGSTILDLSNVSKEKFHELPSEHWEELIESWLCCSSMELDLSSGKSGDSKDGKGAEKIFWPKGKEVLGGEGYLLVEEEMVEEGSWVVRHGGSTEIWQPIACSVCSFPLGRRFIHSTQNSTFKFTKYSLTLSPSLSSPTALKRGLGSVDVNPDVGGSSLEQFVAADMRALADAHRCYHFILVDEEVQEGAVIQSEGTPRILIWMLNANLDLTIRPSKPIQSTSLEGESENLPFRAIKILYLPLMSSSEIPPTFPMSKAEFLPYPKIVCDRLEQTLNRSWDFYPREAREMMGLRMSWLRRF